MKLYKYLFVAAAVLMSACTEDAIDDLTGMYPAPDNYSFATATDNGVVKDGKTKKYFNVDFATTAGDVLSMKFVGDQYFLHPAAFTPAESVETAKKGNYICNESTFTKKGGSATNISRGILTVGKDNDNYTVAGTLWLVNGDIIKVNGGGTIVYEPNDPMALVEYKGCQNNDDGTATVTFSTGGYTEELDMTTWQMVYTGEGNDLQIQFILLDGELQPGVYSPGTGYVAGGQTEVDWGWGPMMMDYGTIWYTIANGQKTANYISTGDITVEKAGSKFTVTIDQGKGGVFAQFEGQIPELSGEQGGGEVEPEYIELTKVLSAVDNNANGTKSVTLNLGTDGIETTPNAWGGMDYTGDGNYLAIDLYSTDGKINAGTYKPADANAMSEFTYGMGWDPGDLWGIGMVFENWGTCWWTATADGNSAQHIEEGDINVAVDGDNITITYNHNGLAFRFRGTIEGFGGVAGGGETPSTPDVEYIEISNFLSATNNVPNGSNSISLQLASDGITASPGAWGVELSGDGNYLKIDLYSADGTLAEGTYTPVESAALAEGNFAKGYDTEMWGMQFYNWGTCWMTRANGAETGVHIEDGTITVEKSGDNYIISLQSSAVNVRYTGPINL